MGPVDWKTSTDADYMLRSIHRKCSDRKLRLFALACVGRIAHLVTDPRSRAAIEFAELHSEVGVARKKGRPRLEKAARACCAEVHDAWQKSDPSRYCEYLIAHHAAYAASATLATNAFQAADLCAQFAANAAAWKALGNIPTAPGALEAAKGPERKEQATLLRDIIHPFRELETDPVWSVWNGGAIVKLAQGIHDDRAFDRLPVLADALEEAGCSDNELLQHWREQEHHARGCWLVDLVLGLR